MRKSVNIKQHLRDYQALLALVDQLGGCVQQKYAAHIACKKGCDLCCRNLSIFPVEALSLALALQQLPSTMQQRIHQKAAAAISDMSCPLLEEQACTLYAFRPIICRTHGLPLRTVYNRRQSIGFCQHNFKNLATIPDDAIINLDPINRTLAAVNAVLVSEVAPVRRLPERLSIAEAIQTELG
jgi:Fe-S-cluster containining protein